MIQMIADRRKKMFKFIAKVEGMMCPMCEKRVNKAVSSAFSVKSVVSDHEKNLTEILSSDSKITLL